MRWLFFIALCAVLLLVVFGMSLLEGAPADTVHPVIDATDGAMLFGGTINGKWADAEKLKSLVKGGEHYRLYTPTKYLGEAIGSKPEDDPEGHAMPDISLNSPVKVRDGETVIGVGGAWNAPQQFSTKQALYTRVVHDYLTTVGLPKAPVRITRIWKIDLEGDKQDEVLIAATIPRPYPDYKWQANDYSLVLVRKIINGVVRTVPIKCCCVISDKDTDVPELYTLNAVLDVNGDGIMEIVVGHSYYEGAGMHIYQLKGEKVIDTTLDAGDYV